MKSRFVMTQLMKDARKHPSCLEYVAKKLNFTLAPNFNMFIDGDSLIINNNGSKIAVLYDQFKGFYLGT